MITSFFRRSRLWTTEEELWLATLQRKVSPEITAVKIERRFLVDSSRALRSDELDKLKWLLKETFEPEMFKESSMLDAGYSMLVENRESRIVLDADMRELRGIWQQTSYELDKLQANPACVEAERKASFERKGPHYELFFNPAPTPREKMEAKNKPKVAILREAGTNGAREMAGAFFAAGFEPWDVTMADIADGRVRAYPNNPSSFVIPSTSSGGTLRRSRRIWPTKRRFFTSLRSVQNDRRERIVIRIGSKS
ncbi:MAG: phosphoribosylformylglycinamidine synthase subunit PurQ [Planctomycetota bacterium]